MDPRFSPFDPVIWLAFMAFAAAIWAIVALFHRKYPDYGRFGDQAKPGSGEPGSDCRP